VALLRASLSLHRTLQQGIGMSLIPLADGGVAYLWSGERWLSAPNNNPSCPDECRPTTGECAEPTDYIKGNGFSYWIPLQFDADGNVMQFASFVDRYVCRHCRLGCCCCSCSCCCCAAAAVVVATAAAAAAVCVVACGLTLCGCVMCICVPAWKCVYVCTAASRHQLHTGRR
jgi:hypothetical protein